jgi:hypothetical protein
MKHEDDLAAELDDSAATGAMEEYLADAAAAEAALERDEAEAVIE